MPSENVDLIVENANQVVTIAGHSRKPATGTLMEDLGIIENGAVAIRNGEIVQVGATHEILTRFLSEEHLDATGKIVTPGFIDAHTHFLFAGSRESELAMKIKGANYMEIMKQGGGILKTVRDTRAASRADLMGICRERGANLIINGATTIEAKSGYGLTFEEEVRSLEIIRDLNGSIPVTLVPTFLAHAIPPEYENRTAEYATIISEEWIPEISRRRLATFCDVFCEKDVFEVDDSRRILTAGKRNGLMPRIHADEFYALGGAELAAEVGAVSADHLLQVSSTGLERMKKAGVIATLLPAAPMTLMTNYPDARKIIGAGVPVALGSDLNPSCWVENHQLVIALACYKLKMTPAEALVASTINAAHALRMADKIGSLEVGKVADMLVIDAPNYQFLGYRFGKNLVDTVVKNGKLVAQNGRLLP